MTFHQHCFYNKQFIITGSLPALLLKIALHFKGKFLQQLTKHSVRLLVDDFLVISEFLGLRYWSFDTLTESPQSGRSTKYYVRGYSIITILFYMILLFLEHVIYYTNICK